MAPEASLARFGWGVFGSNIGNTIFLSSVFRTLNTPSTTAVVDSLYPEMWTGDIDRLAADINERFCAYVIPLANAFRSGWERSLNRLTRLIRRLTIPCVVVGVGIQSQLDNGAVGDAKTTDAARKFVTAVLDHSAVFGVRGEMTKQYLLGLGFPDDRIDVIGCPSLFDNPGDLTVTRRVDHISSDDNLAVNITPSKPPLPDKILNKVFDDYPNAIYVAQQYEELRMLLWGISWTKAHPLLPCHTDHPLYKEDRIRFFLDPVRWKQFMKTRVFAFGSRLHGNLAAVASGTPALLVAHDSRTLEIAQYHAVPYILAKDVPVESPIDHLYEKADYGEFNRRHPELFAHYLEFLTKNELANIYQAGNTNPAYDAWLKPKRFPEPVGVIEAHLDPAGRELLRKLAWLRGNEQIDKERASTGFDYGFIPSEVTDSLNSR
jgi:hypothetical protein